MSKPNVNKKKAISYLQQTHNYVWRGAYLHFECKACTAPDAVAGNSGVYNVYSNSVRCYQSSCQFHSSKVDPVTKRSWKRFQHYYEQTTSNHFEIFQHMVLPLADINIDELIKPFYVDRTKFYFPTEATPYDMGGNDFYDRFKKYVESRGFDYETLCEDYHLYYAQTGYYKGYMIIPYLNQHGNFEYYQARDFIGRGKSDRWKFPSSEKIGMNKKNVIYDKLNLVNPMYTDLGITEGAFDKYSFDQLGSPFRATFLGGLTVEDPQLYFIKTQEHFKRVWLFIDPNTFEAAFSLATKLLAGASYELIMVSLDHYYKVNEWSEKKLNYDLNDIFKDPKLGLDTIKEIMASKSAFKISTKGHLLQLKRKLKKLLV